MSIVKQFKHAARLLFAVLREIFDEAAYERFLRRHELSATGASYAHFCREHYQGKQARPRCC